MTEPHKTINNKEKNMLVSETNTENFLSTLKQSVSSSFTTNTTTTNSVHNSNGSIVSSLEGSKIENNSSKIFNKLQRKLSK